MDPIIRTIYFAHKLEKLEHFVVVDIEKYPEIKERFDPNAHGKYFLITQDHYYIKDKNNCGSIQEFISRCHDYRPPVAKG